MATALKVMKVLLVEDEHEHAELIRRNLSRKHSSEIKLEWVQCLADCLKSLRESNIDVVLLDLGLPDSSLNQTLDEVLSQDHGIAIVVLSSLADDAFAISAVQKGAQDYIAKSHMDGELLFRTLRYAIERNATAMELKKAKEMADAANRAKSAFLANMSHEIRSPLNSVIGYADLLRDPNLSDARREQFISTIVRNGRHLVQLIDDILDLSKIEAEKLVIEHRSFLITSLLTEIKELHEVQAQEKGLTFCLTSEGALPESITSDPLRLKQILINIVGNAIKFTQKGGVSVQCKFIKAAKEFESQLEFVVTDSGRGIMPEHQALLFKPFSQGDSSTTRTFGGSGLGLVLARRLARALGGDVVLSESLPGKGSVFTISILASEAQGAFFQLKPEIEVEAMAYQAPSGLQGLKVLVAEDRPDLQTLMAYVLKSQGALVTIAENGALAVEMALEQPFDLILMDLQMPVQDGFDATRDLRKLGYTKPILALSAAAMEEEKVRSIQAGCNDHLTKPIKTQLLIEKVRQYTLGRIA